MVYSEGVWYLGGSKFEKKEEAEVRIYCLWGKEMSYLPRSR